jgi:hypothetical protein
MAETLVASPNVYTIQGREVRLPVEVRRATAAVAYYLVPSAAAQRLIDHTGLRIVSMLPGRTICTIGAIDYSDGDLGPYHEVALTFFVRQRGQRSLPLGGMLGMIRGGLDAYIHQLPVDSEFSRDAGCGIWGFPKYMSTIDITNDAESQTAVLTVDSQHVLTQTIRAGEASRSFADRPQTSYAYRDGVLYRTPSTMTAEGIVAARGSDELQLGSHAMAGELRSLGLPKRALFTTYIANMSGRFFAAERVAT